MFNRKRPLWSAQRRVAACLAAWAMLAVVPVHAQLTGVGPASPDTADQNAVMRSVTPYLAVGDYAEDRGRVFMFFEFTCPYCQANWHALMSWGATLPRGFRLVPVPVVTDDPDTRAAALAFYTVKALAPARLEAFMALAFQVAQQGASHSASRAQPYIAILQQMGLDGAAVQRYAGSAELRERTKRGMDLVERYNVEVTPSFGIGGQYETNANFTNGDYVLLARLLSGLVSRQIEQGKTPPPTP